MIAPFLACLLAQDLAITGATVIDGNGGPVRRDATVVIHGDRIVGVGAKVPAGAQVIDGRGRFLVPGFIDTNVHLSLYGGARDRYETIAKYHGRQDEIVLEGAQIALRYGVTTVRDSYGMLLPLRRVRDRIARGEVTGSRIRAAGNIVGWGGPYSISFSLTPQTGLTRFQEEMNDAITQGAGENLADLTPAELRRAINRYLDKGPDFLKFGGTSHFSQPTYIGFSLEAQKAMVEEAHKRGRAAETHSTTIEGLRLSLEAGVDLVQHPEVLSPREMPAELIAMMRERKVICSMLVNTITGEAWAKHLKDKPEGEKKYAGRILTGAGERRKAAELGLDMETRRKNAQALIAGGCIATVGTDNYWAAAPEFAIDPKPEAQSHGIGTILAIEGLVELGMSPLQAITAGTRNGAFACRRQADLGTIEAGKLADLLLLEADPLADIHNIRKLGTVISSGKVIDRDGLPTTTVLSVPVDKRAPEVFRARLETTKGPIVMEFHREWAPLGVDHFYTLAMAGYFDDTRFYRVVKDKWAQFGINGDPAVSKVWRTRTISDEPRKISNVRGTVAFAFAVANGRTTQVFINLVDNSPGHDREPFVPLARVVEGMDAADALYSGYGETSGGGIRGGKQGPLFEEGNAYLDRGYPKLDRIQRVVIVP